MSMTRPLNRHPQAIRKLHVEFIGFDHRLATFGFGDTKALASACGPIEVRTAAELPSKATLEINVRPLSGIAGTPERLLASAIKAVFSSSILLTHHPRTLIQIVLQILAPPAPTQLSYTPLGKTTPKPFFDVNPSITASLINSASLALLHCGSIPMAGVPCAVAIGILNTPRNEMGASGEKATAINRIMVLDPEESEVASLVGGGVFAIHFSRGKESLSSDLSSEERPEVEGEVVWCSSEGLFVEEFIEAQALAIEGAKRVLQSIRSALAGEHAGVDEETEEGMDIDRAR